MAIVLGALLGLERGFRGRPAGLRTHALVSLGAALYTVVSISFIDSDPSRVAAGIVTGIGFLGAGAIFRAEDKVRGLTTAATLWVTAAIGLAVGLGYFSMAIIVTLFILLVLTYGSFFEQKATKVITRNKEKIIMQ